MLQRPLDHIVAPLSSAMLLERLAFDNQRSTVLERLRVEGCERH